MRNTGSFARKNNMGELVCEDLDRAIKKKYKPDTICKSSIISFFIMVICITIDIAFYINLFRLISYDEPNMIILEVAGLSMASDFVPIYIAMIAKRIRQGISKEKPLLALSIIVTVIALITNAFIRIATMSTVSSSGTLDAPTLCITLFAVIVPIMTSLTSGIVSYYAYDPLSKKMLKEEIGIAELTEEIRRYKAIISDYTYDENCEEELKKLDTGYYNIAKRSLLNEAVAICNNVRVKLMEYLGNPTATNMLSESQVDDVFNRLNKELVSLNDSIDVINDLTDKAEIK